MVFVYLLICLHSEEFWPGMTVLTPYSITLLEEGELSVALPRCSGFIPSVLKTMVKGSSVIYPTPTAAAW